MPAFNRLSPVSSTPSSSPNPPSHPAPPAPISEQKPAAMVAERHAPVRQPGRVDALPPWKVLLHNDDQNNLEFVIMALIQLAAMKLEAATKVVSEAHHTGVALICATHRERAELFQEQFTSKGLTVTIEPSR